jgi:hypothetical protein
MKRIVLMAIAIAVASLLSFPVAILAGSPSAPNYGKYNPANLPGQPPEEWGVEKVIPLPLAPGGAVRIITDPLNGSAPADGWVTFWCQSHLGFQYNIGATGLDAISTYSVVADGVQIQIVAPGTVGAIEVEPGLWILPSSAVPVELDLGSFVSDATGSGGVKGVARLPAGYVYDVATTVSNANDEPVLSSPYDDTNEFIVYEI